MRLRVHSVIYHSGAAPGLDHHYRELRSAMFHLGQQYAYLQPGAAWRPAMDIHETADAVLVKIELAGMAEESIEILLYPNAVVVTGERADDGDSDEDTYYHEAQIRYGPFRADAYLSTPVQTDLASAVYQNGMLRISLPRRSQEGVSTDEPEQGTESQRGVVGSDNPDAGEHAGSSPFGHAMTTQPASGRLTYTSLKEISHA